MDNSVLRTQLSILSTFTAYEAGSVLGAALLLGGSEVEGDAGLSAQPLEPTLIPVCKVVHPGAGWFARTGGTF